MTTVTCTCVNALNIGKTTNYPGTTNNQGLTHRGHGLRSYQQYITIQAISCCNTFTQHWYSIQLSRHAKLIICYRVFFHPSENFMKIKRFKYWNSISSILTYAHVLPQMTQVQQVASLKRTDSKHNRQFSAVNPAPALLIPTLTPLWATATWVNTNAWDDSITKLGKTDHRDRYSLCIVCQRYHINRCSLLYSANETESIFHSSSSHQISIKLQFNTTKLAQKIKRKIKQKQKKSS